MRRWRVKSGLNSAWVILLLVSATPAISGVDTLWTRYQPFTDPALWSSFVFDLFVDPSGDIIVGGVGTCCLDGSAFGLLKFNANGDTLWTRFLDQFSGPSGGAYRTVVDDSGYIYITGAGSTTIKFNPDGDTFWVRRLSLRSDLITLDKDGFVYVLDRTLGATKFSSAGDTVWTNNQAGFAIISFGHDGGMACDALGNLYIGGPTAAGDIIAKYSPSGDTVWTRPFDDWLGDLAVDPDGTVYATGYSESVATGRDYKAVKLAPNGDELWVALSDGPSSGSDFAWFVAVDYEGSVVVTGMTDDFTGDLPTIKYSSQGDSLWAALFEGSSVSPWSEPLALDDSGNVYISGSSGVVKYAADGTERWRIDYPAAAQAGAIDVSPSFVVYVANWDGFVAAYSQADVDNDGAIDVYDNCLATPNPDQANNDSDSLGDTCDNCPAVTNPYQVHTIEMTGDVNADSVITSADIIYMVNFIFKGGLEPVACKAAGDANCSGSCTSADIIFWSATCSRGAPLPAMSVLPVRVRGAVRSWSGATPRSFV